MNKKIIEIEDAESISRKIRKEGQTIVLVGGVFDILHLGHVNFLQKAKKEADVLFLLLESDEFVRKTKGGKRPINNQTERAQVLAALKDVDFVITAKGILKNEDYDKIVKQIHPKVIATTAPDINIAHKKRQAKMIKARVKSVIKRIRNKSTTEILRLIE